MRVRLPDETIKFFEEQDRKAGIDVDARKRKKEQENAEWEKKKGNIKLSEEELKKFDIDPNDPLSIEDLAHYGV